MATKKKPNKGAKKSITQAERLAQKLSFWSKMKARSQVHEDRAMTLLAGRELPPSLAAAIQQRAEGGGTRRWGTDAEDAMSLALSSGSVDLERHVAEMVAEDRAGLPLASLRCALLRDQAADHARTRRSKGSSAEARTGHARGDKMRACSVVAPCGTWGCGRSACSRAYWRRGTAIERFVRRAMLTACAAPDVVRLVQITLTGGVDFSAGAAVSEAMRSFSGAARAMLATPAARSALHRDATHVSIECGWHETAAGGWRAQPHAHVTSLVPAGTTNTAIRERLTASWQICAADPSAVVAPGPIGLSEDDVKAWTRYLGKNVEARMADGAKVTGLGLPLVLDDASLVAVVAMIDKNAVHQWQWRAYGTHAAKNGRPLASSLRSSARLALRRAGMDMTDARWTEAMHGTWDPFCVQLPAVRLEHAIEVPVVRRPDARLRLASCVDDVSRDEYEAHALSDADWRVARKWNLAMRMRRMCSMRAA